MILIDTIIFDLDGTLIDSLEDLASSVNLMRNHYGLRPLPTPQIGRYVGNGSRKLVERALGGTEPNVEEALELFLRFYDQHLLDNTKLMPCVVEALETFSEKNLAVVSNKVAAFAENILDRFNLKRFFGLILGGDSTKKIKPDPEPVLEVMQFFATPSRKCLMVGDSYTDIRAGKAAGTYTCYVKGIGSLENETSDFCLQSLCELRKYIV